MVNVIIGNIDDFCGKDSNEGEKMEKLIEDLNQFNIDCNSTAGKYFVDAMLNYILDARRISFLTEDNFEACLLKITPHDKVDYRNPDGKFKKLIDKLNDGWQVVSSRDYFEMDTMTVVLGRELKRKEDDKTDKVNLEFNDQEWACKFFNGIAVHITRNGESGEFMVPYRYKKRTQEIEVSWGKK